MSTFQVFFTNTASASVTVEAADFEEAVELAWEELPSGVCAQCSGWGRDYGLDLGEWQEDETSYVVDGEFVEVKP